KSSENCLNQTSEYQTSEFQTSEYQTSEYQTSEYQTSEYQTSEYQTSEFQTSEYQTSEFQTSEYETSEYQTSEFQTSEYQTSEYQTSEYQTSEFQTSEYQTSEFQTSEYETREYETSEYQTSEFQTSEYQTSEYQTSEYQTSEYQTSEYQTSEFQTSEYQTSEFQTSEYETSEFQTSEYETSEYRPTSEFQTSEYQTSEFQTSEYKTSEFQTSEYETSEFQTSEYETSEYQTSEFQTSEYETSEYETSEFQTSEYETSEFQTMHAGSVWASVRGHRRCVLANGVTVEEVLLGIGKEIGYDSISSASRTNKAVVVFVKEESHVRHLTNVGIVVSGEFVLVSPLIAPMVRVTLSNVPLFIPNGEIERGLTRYGKLASAIRTVPLGCKNGALKHVMSFRRHVFMFLNEQELDVSFRVGYEGRTYMVYANTGNMKCFQCGHVEYKRLAFPHKAQASEEAHSQGNERATRLGSREETRQEIEEEDRQEIEEEDTQEIEEEDRPREKVPKPIQLGRSQLTEQEHRQRGQMRLCYYCGASGHLIHRCPERPSSAQTLELPLTSGRIPHVYEDFWEVFSEERAARLPLHQA
ncbi:hypothetical protein QTP86_020739, partial [Hemibagrus guttatus]